MPVRASRRLACRFGLAAAELPGICGGRGHAGEDPIHGRTGFLDGVGGRADVVVRVATVAAPLEEPAVRFGIVAHRSQSSWRPFLGRLASELIEAEQPAAHVAKPAGGWQSARTQHLPAGLAWIFRLRPVPLLYTLSRDSGSRIVANWPSDSY